MKIKKLFISIMFFTILGTIGSISAQAETTDGAMVPNIESTEQIEPRADIIERVYRQTPWGTLQYRRWNSTRGYWVDPDWIDL